MTNNVHSVLQETMSPVRHLIFSAANRKIIISVGVFSAKPQILRRFFGLYKIIELGGLQRRLRPLISDCISRTIQMLHVTPAWNVNCQRILTKSRIACIATARVTPAAGESMLRSSSTSSMDYSLPRLRTKFGERAFSHAGPATWNALPDNVRTVADPVKFRKLLKSLYFSQSFNIC